MTKKEDRFTPEEYLKYLEDDDTTRHILVEGRDDKRIFELLLHVLCHERERIVVDSAEDLVDCRPENCKAVEYICERMIDEPYADRLAAFVDREFREFDDQALELSDCIDGHKVCGRLVWSRGHSIENYLFDLNTLRDPLIAFSRSGFSEALSCFERVFESAVRNACAIGLAARDVGKLRRVRTSIDVSLLDIDGSEVKVDFDDWRVKLAGKLSENEIEELFRRYRFWYDRVLRADYDVVRWMCDGHIGFDLIWAVYDLCVQLAGQTGTLKSKRPIPFNVCANSWVKSAGYRLHECPVAVFDLLEVNIH